MYDRAIHVVHRFSLIGAIPLNTKCIADRCSEDVSCPLLIRLLIGAFWFIRRIDVYCPKGHEFESRSSRHVHVGALMGKSFDRSCLWRFGVKLRHSTRAVSGAPLRDGGLEEAL